MEIGEKLPNPTSEKKQKKAKRLNKTGIYFKDLAPRDTLSDDEKNLLASREKNPEWMVEDLMLQSNLSEEKS